MIEVVGLIGSDQFVLYLKTEAFRILSEHDGQGWATYCVGKLIITLYELHAKHRFKNCGEIRNDDGNCKQEVIFK